MKISDVITMVRDRVNDSASTFYTDAEIARTVDIHVRALFRQRADADPTYGLTRLNILDTSDNVSQVYSDVYAYSLPTWVYKIHAVRERATTSQGEGKMLPHVPYRHKGYGWTWAGDRVIHVRGSSAIKSIIVECAKTPAQLHTGALPVVSPNSTSMYLDTTPSIPTGGSLDWEEGAYLNSKIEITGTTSESGSVFNRGRVLTVTGSDRRYVSSAWYVLATVTPPQTASATAATATYEMHPEIDDGHLNYLVLLVADTLFQKTNNVNGIQALQTQLNLERAQFNNWLIPRQDQQQYFLTDPANVEIPPYDEDRDYIHHSFPW